MSFLTRLRDLWRDPAGTKALTLTMVNDDFGRNGEYFGPLAVSSTSSADRERIEQTYEDYVTNAYKSNGIVFACTQARALPFSEARFQYQRFNNGRPGDLFGDASLALLETPWPNGTTGELLMRMEQDASLAGNCYLTTVGTGDKRRIRRMRPDWVTILSGVRGDPDASPWELEAELLGYFYEPQGWTRGTRKTVFLTPERVVHYSPTPDPDAQWRGMSWLTPVLREISADHQATELKVKMFRSPTIPFAIKYDKSVKPEAFERFISLFNETHSGPENAFKVLHLGGGADPVTVGANLQQLDFKAIQGAGETRIAAASGVGAIIARLSEGMAGSALNEGNYGAAKRQFADMYLRPWWRMAAASLSKFTAPPSGSRLWYDDRDIAFLAEDQKDAATILSTNAATVKSLTDAGYEPDAAIAAVQAGDLGLLAGKHTGLFSVQLQRPGAAEAAAVGSEAT